MWGEGTWGSRASRFPAGEGALLNCTGAVLMAGFLGVLLINFPFRLRLPAPTFPEDKPLRSTSCSLFIMLLCKYLTFPVNASEHVCQVISREVYIRREALSGLDVRRP